MNSHTSSSKRLKQHRIRQRSVSFGNPALGTYHGAVYTWEDNGDSSSRDSRPVVEGAIDIRCTAAMVDVPPNQVPEGIMNLSQSHRPYIHHVRIVIADPFLPGNSLGNTHASGGADDDEPLVPSKALSPGTEAFENAASIFAKEDDEHQRMIASNHRPSQTPERTYLVLFEFYSEDAVDLFVEDLHDQPYTFLDDTVRCQVYPVIAIQGVDGVSLLAPLFAPSSSPHKSNPPSEGSNHSNKLVVEDYNCAVCLERMDLDTTAAAGDGSSSTSILTTVCNHSFHFDCLMQWQDSPCPVCRYDHSGLNDDALFSQCHICSTTHNNYVCLICGVISCGGGGNGSPNLPDGSLSPPRSSATHAARDPNGTDAPAPCCSSPDSFEETLSQHLRQRSQILPNSHAWTHYNETLHAYALCTETQHVWDFAGQGYVHRLLQNKEDGKLVEVNDPTNTTSQERSLSPGLTEAQEGEVVHRKLESFASQYYTLLKSQLEQQRIYYEGRLEEIRREYQTRAARGRSAPSAKPRVGTASDLISALKQERQQLSQRLHSIQVKCRKVEEDVSFITSLNESLEANREPLRRQLEQAQKEQAETRKMFAECLPPLQEQVTRLMLQLESSSNHHDIPESLDDGNRKPAAK
jgi:BRCA1-associated protein